MFANDHDGGGGGDAFAIRDFWKLSALTIEPENPVTRSLDQFGLGEIEGSNAALFPTLKDISLNLPSFESFEYGTLDDLSAPESVAASEFDALQLPEEEEEYNKQVEDLWITAGRDDPLTRPPIFRAWERFYDHKFVEPIRYLSDASEGAFDAVLRLNASQNDSIVNNAPVLPRQPVLKALFLLGIGQESRLFRYDNLANAFALPDGEFSVTGLSTGLTKAFAKRFATSGGQFRTLHSFVRQIYSMAESSSTQIALAETIFKILSALNRHLVPVCANVQSMVQLQTSFRQSILILEYLSCLISRIQISGQDHDIISELYQFAEDSEHHSGWARALILQILARVSATWFEALNACLGLQSNCVNLGLRERVIRFAEQHINGEGVGPANVIPKFLAGKELETILQTCHSLEILKAHHGSLFLLDEECVRGLESPNLRWCFKWKDVELVNKTTREYEIRVLESMKEGGVLIKRPVAVQSTVGEASDYPFNPFEANERILKMRLSESQIHLQQLMPPEQPWEHDPLCQTLQRVLFQQSEEEEDENFAFAPLLSLIPELSFGPVISSQARLVNRACLQMLFQKHNLTSHLLVQQRFHLFGDGMFATRLSQALFDPSLQSAERSKGHSRNAGKLGLRLGSRSTWPPASSELRVALMGVLTETYNDSLPPNSINSTNPSSSSLELPGNLSFALRDDLSESEIALCLNAAGLQALDFLRLRYQPPPPLDAVLTASSLDKYDRIFKFLLRIQRLQALTIQRAHSRLFHRGGSGTKKRLPPTLKGSSITANSTKSTISATAKEERGDHVLSIRMHFETSTFITTVADYFLGAGISVPWDRFFGRVKALEDCLEGREKRSSSKEEKAEEEDGYGYGLHSLRLMHERMLDQVLSNLLLRRRQERVMRVLEEIFGLVLKFESAGDGDGAEREPKKEEDKKELYTEFRNKVRLLLAVCKGISGERLGRGGGGGVEDREKDEWEVNTIEQLVLRLEMNGWYDAGTGATA